MITPSAQALSIVKDASSLTEHALQALSILREPAQFKWYIILFLLMVFSLHQGGGGAELVRRPCRAGVLGDGLV